MELDIPGTLDPYSAAQWIRIRFQNTGKIPDPHDLNQEKKARLKAEKAERNAQKKSEKTLKRNAKNNKKITKKMSTKNHFEM